MNVTAVIPTRGDVNMKPILAPLNVAQRIVWDNSVEEDLGVYGRYAAIERADHDVILTVDDDTVLPVETVGKLLAAYTPGAVVCNVPRKFRQRGGDPYTDSGLVGFGAIFDRDLPFLAFARYLSLGGKTKTAEFRRCCDLVFTMLTPLVMVDLPYEPLSYAHNETRMWRQPGHFEEREEMRQFIRQLKARAA